MVNIKYLAGAVLFCSVFLFGSQTVQACLCELPDFKKSVEGRVKEAFDASAAVFVGEVDEIKSASELEREITFTVRSRLKGKESTTLQVSTGKGNGDCGFPFQKREVYLVFA